MASLPLPTAADYEHCVAISERVSWTVDDILGEDQELDFRRPFLPESMVGLASSPLSDADRLRLNHIRANSYLHLFVFLEEYIIGTAMQRAKAQTDAPAAAHALLRFADEEIKHQQLFRRFRTAFERGFGAPAPTVDNAVEAAAYILGKSPLGVMLVTLHVELATQLHYVESVQSDEGLEPLFQSLLKHHWIEEAQHARIDALEIAQLAHGANPLVCETAIADYEDIINAFDGVLARQVELDLDTLARLTRPLAPEVRDTLRIQQHRSYRRSFLLDGLQHRAFTATARVLLPSAETRLERLRHHLA